MQKKVYESSPCIVLGLVSGCLDPYNATELIYNRERALLSETNQPTTPAWKNK